MLNIPPEALSSPSGYYEVGTEIYVNKSDALVAGTRLNIWPKWRFFSDTWKKQDWRSPPQIDLYTLYQGRARQLRDKYDYICLSFSGGSDSTTMLQAFVDSNTHIDEVLVKWPIRATSRLSVTKDPNPANILSEWQLTVLPLLGHYQKILGSKTKFTVSDWSDRVFDRAASEEIVWQGCQDHLNPSTFIRQSYLSDDTHAAIDAGKSACIVFGVDKPLVAHRKNWIYCYFMDRMAHTHAAHPWDRYVELFYWSPDFPDIVPAQAKIIYQYLQNNPQYTKLIDWIERPSRVEVDIWNVIIRNLIYPEYMKHHWFQAPKPTSWVYDEIDQWMYSDQMLSRYLQSWKSNLQNRIGSIDEKYIDRSNGSLQGYIGFIDDMYLLGPATKNPQG